MNDHYYSASPVSEHRYAEADYVYRGHALRFTTDAGVFSRGEVDFGTDVHIAENGVDVQEQKELIYQMMLKWK